MNLIGSILMAGGIAVGHAQFPVNITGTVNDEMSLAPLVGAKVSLAANPNITTTSGAEGKFTLTGEAAVGMRKGAPDLSNMVSKGSELSFSIVAGNMPVTVSLHTLKDEFVRTILDQKLNSGNYVLNVAQADLARGAYLVRARVGSQSSVFKVINLGARGQNGLSMNTGASRPALSKSAAVIVDTVIVTKDGYRRGSKSISSFTAANVTVLARPKLSQISVVSAKQPTVWANCDAFVYDPQPGTQLKGNWTLNPFEGGDSWRVTFLDAQPYSVWAFAPKTGTADMSDFKDGALHIAVKGTVPTLGLYMASPENSSNATKVDITKFGYKPDGAWHDMTIPTSEFTGTNFEQISAYLGMGYPLLDTDTFDPTLEYQIDGVYWTATK